jgi:DNA-binding LytR/AlgR family response regulator
MRAATLIAAVWTAVAAVAAVQAVALVRLDGRTDMLVSIVSRLSILPLWALATPIILRSARTFPVVDGEWRPNASAAVLHVAFGSLFIVATNAIIRLPLAFGSDTFGAGANVLVRSTLEGVAEYYPPALVVYAVIVAVGHVLGGRKTTTDVVQSPPAAAVTDRHVAASRAPAADLPPTASAAAALDDSPVATLDGHLTVRQWNRVHLLRVEEIDWVEAQDNYVVVHAGTRAYKGRERISDVEVQLDPRRFVRIHRSTIVQVAKIREVQPLTHGDHAVILRDGTVLRVARSRRDALGEALGLEL